MAPYFDPEYLARLDRLSRVDDAAEQLRLAPTTLRRWVREDRIRSHKLNADPWRDVLDFTSCRPVTYVRVREVLADASTRPCAAHES